MNLFHATVDKTLIATGLALALVGPACAQSAKDIDELRLEVRRLRGEVTELKRAPAKGVATTPAVASDGAIAGGMLVPGTQTSLHLYGHIEAHAIHDMKASSPTDNFTDLAFQPLDNSGAQWARTKLTAETSRLGFKTSTPAPGGALTTKLEMDFYAYGNDTRNRLRLRHAYGEYNGWLIGQTWSTFMDLDNLPETVDFNGPVGAPFSRRTMVRYAYANAQAGYTLTASLEDPQDQARLGTINSDNERWPQLVLRYDQAWSRGSMNLRALTHEKRSVTTTRRGYGFAFGGRYKLTDDDLLMTQYTRVDGDADQLYGSNGYAITAKGTISFDRNQGLVAGYTRTFSPRLRGTAAFGMNKAKTAAALDNRRLQELFVNLIYAPLAGVELGAEYIRGERKTFAGDIGTLSRFDLMARYTF